VSENSSFLIQESSNPTCPKDSAKKNKGKKTTIAFEDVFHITIFFIGLG